MSGALVDGATETSKCELAAADGHHLVELRTFPDARGSLGVIEFGTEIGFPVERVYYMYGAKEGSARGAHAHKKLEQLVVAMHGSFEISLDNGHGRCVHRLDRPDLGLYVGPGVWRDLSDFSADSVCVVLASHRWDDDDYIRDYDEFIKSRRG